MNRWWDRKVPLWLQLGFGRVLCLHYGHEWTRYVFCDYCGKEKPE